MLALYKDICYNIYVVKESHLKKDFTKKQTKGLQSETPYAIIYIGLRKAQTKLHKNCNRKGCNRSSNMI